MTPSDFAPHLSFRPQEERRARLPKYTPASTAAPVGPPPVSAVMSAGALPPGGLPQFSAVGQPVIAGNPFAMAAARAPMPGVVPGMIPGMIPGQPPPGMFQQPPMMGAGAPPGMMRQPFGKHATLFPICYSFFFLSLSDPPKRKSF